MKPETLALGVGSVAALVLFASPAQAVTCTVKGTIRVESMDTYYCDPDITGIDCTGWLEKDLNDKREGSAPPLRFSRTQIRNTSNTLLAEANTDANGFYQAVFNASSCTGYDIRVHTYMLRSNPSSFLTGQFRIIDASGLTLSSYKQQAMAGSTTTVDRVFQAKSNPDINQRSATMYHTAASAIDQIRTWSTNLSSYFGYKDTSTGGNGMLRITYYNGAGGGFFNEPQWRIEMPWVSYSQGGTLRHEIGHAVQAAYQDRARADIYCGTYNYRNESGHAEKSCEYASVALYEGIATFFGVRSIATSESPGKNAWYCFCAWNDNDHDHQDVCSRTAVSAPGNDKNGDCVGDGTNPEPDQPGGSLARGFLGVGDTFANSVNDCTRLRTSGSPSGSQGCNCTDSGGDGQCDGTWYQQNGWRNESQVVRFLWDVIDSNNESGQDNTSMSIAGLIANLEAMPCTDDGGYASDGNCNEPNRNNVSPPPTCTGTPLNPNCCNPSPDGADITSHTTGDRDSYNIVDLNNDAIIPGDQDDERVLNCVDGNIDVGGP